MKTAEELKRDWSSIKQTRIPKLSKVPKVLEIRRGIREIELAAVKNYYFPFHEVQKARELLAEIDTWLRGAGVLNDASAT